MNIKNFLREFITSLGCLMIALSLTFFTYPQSVAYADDSFVAPADTEVDCEEDATNTSGKAGVYKPGCKFNESLTKLNEAANPMSAEGLIEQFIMYSFAVVALQSLFFTTTQRSRADCPMNNNAQITLRLMQAASILYVLGEMKAKSAMKEAQELVTEAAFAPAVKLDEYVEGSDKEAAKEAARVNRASNSKQIEAYQALLKVYDLKIKGIQTKMELAGVAEVGFLGALATELLMVQAEKRMCDTTFQTESGIATKNKVTIASYNTAALAMTATVYGASICGAASGLMSSATVSYNTTEASKTALAKGKVGLKVAKGIKDKLSILNFFKKIVAIFKPGAASVADAGTDAVEDGAALLEEAADTALATTEDATTKAIQTAQQAQMTAASASCTSCPGCAGMYETVAAYVAAKLKPIYCCGADTLTGANGFTVVPNPSVMDTMIDISIKKIPLIGSNMIEFVKPGILNFMEQYYFALNPINLKTKTASEEVTRLAKFYKQLNDLDKNFEKEFIQNSEFIKMETKLAANEYNENDIGKIISDIKSSIIKSAHAGDDTFAQILGFGGKLMLLSKLFGKFLRNKALPKPKSRMITYGAMGAVNAAVLIYESSKRKSNEDERNIIQNEFIRFSQSHAVSTEYNLENPDNGAGNANGAGNYNPLVDTTGDVACATPKNGGFAPAACPAKVPSSSIKIPKKGNSKL